MPTIIELPDSTQVEFPDGMDELAIHREIVKSFPDLGRQVPSERALIQAPGQAIPTLPGTVLNAPGQAFPIVQQQMEQGAKEPALTAAEAEQMLMTPQVSLPRFGKPGTATRAVSELLSMPIETMTSPAGPLIATAQAVPGLRELVDTTMAASLAKSGAQRLGEASVTGNKEDYVRGVGEMVLGALAAKGAAGRAIGERRVAQAPVVNAEWELMPDGTRRVVPTELRQLNEVNPTAEQATPIQEPPPPEVVPEASGIGTVPVDHESLLKSASRTFEDITGKKPSEAVTGEKPSEITDKIRSLSDEDLKKSYAGSVQVILYYGQRGESVPESHQKLAGDLVDELNRREIPIIPHDEIGARNITPSEPLVGKEIQPSITDLDPTDPLIKKAVEIYASKGAGVDPRTGKTFGLEKTHRGVTGKKLWEDMTPEERYAEFSDYAKKDLEELATIDPSKQEDYMLDRATDFLDPMSGVYKVLLKQRGYTVEGNRIAPPKGKIIGGKEVNNTAETPTVPARDWGTFYEDLVGDLDTFRPARETGARSYEMEDVAQRFVDFAKADKSGKPITKLVSEFAKSDEASTSQIRKLRASLKNILPEEKPTPKTPIKGEIRPGAQPYDPSSQALGISPGVGVFMREDVIPSLQAALKGIGESASGLRNLLSPASAGKEAALGAGIIREHAAKLAQKDVQMREKFAAAHKEMGKMDKASTLKWLDAVEGGMRHTLTGPLRTFSDEARTQLEARLHEIQGLGTGKLQHFIQDYFPHLWKDSRRGLDWILSIFGKKPLRGPASFLKHRTIPTTRQGVAAGLEPVSWNPMDILLAKLHEMDRYVMGQRIFNEFKEKGLAKFSRSDVPPDGFAKINDRIANVIQYRPTVTAAGTPGAPERILRGHYFVQEDAARVLNNYLSPGLQNYAWYKALRWIGNNMNMATLGLSGYHGMFTMIDSGTSKLSLGIEQAARGDYRALGTIPRGLAGTIAANQLEAFYKGSKVLQEYTKPGSIGGDYTRIVDSLIAGGGRVAMPEIFQNSTLKNFLDALKKGNIPGAVLRAPFAAIHAAAYPLMNVIVPRLKLGVFFDMAKEELARLGPTTDRDTIRKAMGKIWDSVDNRMGEVVYDNLFWNKVLKDLSHLAIRSVGWNLGTIRELGGGIVDSATVISRLIKGDPFVTRRMAYMIALPFTVGLMGALYMKLRTGKNPETLEDYLSPQTGNLLPEGEPERVNFPSYLKDIESVKRHPAQTVINKAHPMWGTIANMMQNKDFYGTEIIHPGDPLIQKVQDEMKFIGKSFVPYGISGAQKRTRIEAGAEPVVESFFGIMPVPAELTRSPAENLAIELMRNHMPTGSRTKEEFERRTKEREAIQKIKMGKLTIEQAMDQGLVQENRAKEVAKRADLKYLEYAIGRLSAPEAVKVLEKTKPEEFNSVVDQVESKISRAKSLEEDQKIKLFDAVEELRKKHKQ